MPSFDIVSEVDMHEINNAIDQANREVGTRFDFKGINAKFEVLDPPAVLVSADVDFQVRQMLEILRGKLAKRGVDVKALVEGDIEVRDAKKSTKCIFLLSRKKWFDLCGSVGSISRDLCASG